MIRIKRKKTNPNDYDLLKNIEIRKDFDTKNKIIDYRIYLNNKRIAYMSFDPEYNQVFDVKVSPEFRRKGLATFVYNYIEKDRNVKLEPSQILLPDGKEFWKNRSRKQLLNVLKTRTNPTDKTFLSKIKIKKEKLGIVLLYKAYYNNNVIATIDYVPYDNSVSSIWIETPFRRKGLASFMYDYIEKDQKVSLIPSEIYYQTEEDFGKID